MKEVRWSPVKSRRLKRTRGVSFEEIIEARLIDVMKHPNRDDQRVMLFLHKNYIWLVPFVERDNTIFLKTLYPSRKFTKMIFRRRE